MRSCLQLQRAFEQPGRTVRVHPVPVVNLQIRRLVSGQKTVAVVVLLLPLPCRQLFRVVVGLVQRRLRRCLMRRGRSLVPCGLVFHSMHP